MAYSLDEIRGSPEDSYKMIPQFAYTLELNNSGSVVKYKVDVDGKFLYFFMALSASISGWQHCRLVISIDGTSMKNRNLKLKYKRIVDTVFHACGKAFNIVNFEHEIRLLESFTPGIHEKLESIGFAKWSRAYSPRRRYKVMTTNISESLNSAMLKASELPTCSMLEVL
ncbi:protein FAR1-RELATED SEQUENCE 3-like [Cucumis melo var. makuwa]|uniref:Protein FAR1-RELATED SEQUENCE 3-like n=1 Tax=Cucumis melo var. makuwa TaxID=1194695 RepID=A0A5A7SQA4_CUCMM|nr:protein FAR1-RELATED SEQUENCE 3-like [Cucumis melo var. makuwa]TYK04646.1 protein FAR1-RELATED SEQUENCE 3-like [Cucumis melo var. makuwa]